VPGRSPGGGSHGDRAGRHAGRSPARGGHEPREHPGRPVRRGRAHRSAPVRPTPRVAGAMGSLRHPAFWLIVGLLLVGAGRVGLMVGQAGALYPVATTVALVLIAVFVARGFVAGLWSHTMFTALAGAGVGYAVVRRERSRLSRYGVALLCLAGAWLAHFAWNSPVLSGGFGLGTAGQIAAVLVKGIPALLVVLALVRAAGDREAD